ncbi:two-component system, LytT family, response regulator AlgR [Pseudomonas delhiensis]|uniref:Two-component system, LytT family, response regulator AlgR n=1 Tax=Pseudomonas delhiensis TaxID=366289 RepID=A0A239I8Q2_9PSED|nr:LytTR family DNA-binding domain-containing protein [Pseudomonas delhiensis]SDJ56973.1 two-component system, LytT family, response regulator AlgR [Pseudomonas delhiensis]SNS89782.1 two-component system, LytT family, response regulator AlgR [Pseudomonas delhiensis]
MRQRIATRVGRSLVVIETKDITHFSAEEKYVTAFTAKGRIHFDATLKALEIEFAEAFIRIHRSHLVRSSLVSNLRWDAYSASIGIEGTEIRLPLSRQRVGAVRNLLRARSGVTVIATLEGPLSLAMPATQQAAPALRVP